MIKKLFSVALGAERECSCSYRKTWLDIVFVFDSSKEVNSQDFFAVRNFVASFVKAIPVSQANGAYSRVAIINGGSDATVVANLTAFDNSKAAANAIRELQYRKADAFNLRSALKEAANIIASSERENVKKVVVVFSAKDEPCYYQLRSKTLKEDDENPCRIASHLKVNGHVIITIGMKFDGLHRFPVMRFGSECYTLNFDESLATEFVNAICRANCFCPQPFVQYTNNCEEFGECIYQQGIALSHTDAVDTCAEYGAKISSVHSAQKDAFLRNLASNAGIQKFWIGASENNSVYTWPDGSKITSGDYTNWAPGQPNTASGKCVSEVIQSLSGSWTSEDCEDFVVTRAFLCQLNACDTDNYCPSAKLRVP
uniref:C-type lectin n=1 Tax=Parascaris univalens TaxID=6257 RepID=A0A915APJ9_PARUN